VKPALLIVDDEESVRESFRLVLQDDYDLFFAEDAKATLRALKSQTFNLCLLDIMLPDGSGLDLLRQMKRRDESIDVIMVTALQSVETGLDAMIGKANDYITKPFKINELRGLIKRVLTKRTLKQESLSSKVEINGSTPFCLRGTSKIINGLVKKIEMVALSETPVCLMGEKGSGTEEIARQIHLRSQRANGPFVTFDCSSQSENQLETELFGEEEEDNLPQVGKLEFADKGTIFLKQIDQLSLELQDKLTAILSKKTMFRLKSGIRLPLDVRVIASSDADLNAKVADGFFLKDFYLYLNSHTLIVPSLRERKEDIPLLMGLALKTANRKAKTLVKEMKKEVVQLLTDYPWPGNLQELENSIESMVLFAGKDTLTMEDVPLDVLIQQMNSTKTKKTDKLSFQHVRRQFERNYIRKVLEKTLGNQTLTAKTLGLHRNTLVGKLKKLSLEDDCRKIVRKRRERGLGFRSL
jgi:two-component system response regulator PilR (NtrC family)/two-component system response regulator HydG